MWRSQRRVHTRVLLRKCEADLVQCHHTVKVDLVVCLLHSDPVAVFDRSVTESNAEDLAKLDWLDPNDDLVDDNRVEFLEAIGFLVGSAKST